MSSSSGQSSAFSRLSRPGSGRLHSATPTQESGWSGDSRKSSSINSSPLSLSPTSPLSSSGGAGLVPEHRIVRHNQAGLPLPGGGGEQQEKRNSLKISFSQPNMRKAAALSSRASGPAPPAFCALPSFPSSMSSASLSSTSSEEKSRILLFKSAHSTGKLKLDQGEFDFKAEDLQDQGEIGRGAFGSVNRMLFQRSTFGKVMAVKRIRSTVDEREQKELLMDLDVVVRSNDCPYIVMFYGAIFKEGDCWICMELMDTSTDKFYKLIYDRLRECIPENVIGKITVATAKALNYLKEQLKIMHRDVKPSNILLDRGGNIKLCDFGISGQLVDSIAKTRDAGCRPYMAPERIDPQRAKGYDVRSDVWSLGITLIELSTGCFPYPKWNSVFEQLQQVVHGDPPRLDPAARGGQGLKGGESEFTYEFVNFVNTCLIKEENQRPKYTKLLEHPFIKRSEAEVVDVATYVTLILKRQEKEENMEWQ